LYNRRSLEKRVPALIDISPTVSPRTAVWPGDVAFRRDVALDMARGDHLTLSAITTTTHVGAHADAPSHYARDGVAIAERSLAPYYGLCQVVRARVPAGERLRPQHLPQAIVAPRVLFATGSFPDPERFDEDFASLSPALIALLAQRGVVLVGIDTPSIDPFSSKLLESHGAIARHDLAILEGLVLEHVEPGCYTLAAFPLKLEGADASPVRAVLIS